MGGVSNLLIRHGVVSLGIGMGDGNGNYFLLSASCLVFRVDLDFVICCPVVRGLRIPVLGNRNRVGLELVDEVTLVWILNLLFFGWAVENFIFLI